MKQLTILMVAAAVVLAFSIPAYAQTEGTSQETLTVTGVLKTVNAKENKITVTADDGKDVEYMTTEKTTVMVDGKAATLIDLQVGQTVTLKVTGNTVVSIEAETT